MDRTLFLTGAGGAIGGAVARSFHESGANIFLTDLRADALEDFAASLGSRDRVRFVQADVGEPAQVADAVGRCVATFGGIDFVVPMAGLYPERAFTAMSVEEWKKTIDINLTGVFLACREAASSLRDDSAIV
ncbi:MAG: SDR family NAD(P)-dependent oxidoreductase, partial [Bauldia sp.]